MAFGSGVAVRNEVTLGRRCPRGLAVEPRGTRPGRVLSHTPRCTLAWRCCLCRAIGSVCTGPPPDPARHRVSLAWPGGGRAGALMLCSLHIFVLTGHRPSPAASERCRPPAPGPARPPRLSLRLQGAQRVPLRSQLQVTLLSKFLLIAKSCYEQRNFATAMQILGGLEHLAVRQCPVSAPGPRTQGGGGGGTRVTWAFVPGLENFTCEDGGGHGGAEGRGGTAALPELRQRVRPGAPGPRGPLAVLPATAWPGRQRQPGARSSRSPCWAGLGARGLRSAGRQHGAAARDPE